jgi:predicted DNA-binding protein (MmcQ/YjbR family)
MDAETARAFLLKLPHVVETHQWGDNLVFWTGDKAIGGKMFCLLNLGEGIGGVASYSAGPERYAELLEQDSLIPAPYLARAHWVTAERWSAWRNTEWHDELRAAHAITFAKLPNRVRENLKLPAPAREKLIRERRKLLQQKADAKLPRKK